MADQDSTDNLCLKVHSGVSQSQSQWSCQLAHLSDQKSYYMGQKKGTGMETFAQCLNCQEDKTIVMCPLVQGLFSPRG